MSILVEVKEELLKINKTWVQKNYTPHEWMGILMEEVGESSKEITDRMLGKFVPIEKLEEHSPHCKPDTYYLLQYRKEMIQVAAVAIEAIESLDRNELKGFDKQGKAKKVYYGKSNH